ncbi:ABC transporter related protein OS=Tsukamurella paurometabola (strain ATCC 8368 / DSM / CCUG 35730 / CIP 100753 / JCM 10117 / KCTC 9821 / NBRC 16120 / NCIMB 702349 / NCTC 13040) OX=521096 GN=Tpau_2487 PE=3 SV=1 [Tsukamurella paurometabola]|uniref:ATP-binding cassette domain-containing protein n=1 Tax=Tsukamurella paurometabola TaxID=2061 RepID=UPI00019F048A|nr:ATP-binding cassette domain-containing protein [Tsukamurella paurometabola]SUP34045.1 Putative ABC transporter ATP-binding protein TM_0222 [Tsukamurella paurometabola]
MLISQVFPLLVGLAFAACIPFGVVGLRHTFRTCAMALAVGVCMAFLLGGIAPVTLTIETGLVGVLLGASIGRGWSTGRLVLNSLPLLAIPSSALAVLLLVVFPGAREVIFKITGSTITGIARLLRTIHLGFLGDAMVALWEWALRWWALTVPAVLIVAVLFVVWFARVAFGALLARADRVLPRATGHLADLVDDGDTDRTVGPVPIRMRGVTVRYGDRTALDVPELMVESGEFLAVTGRNGTGKSTLTRVLAGAEPSTGTVERPGDPGLGDPGGTAVVFQRPESQVLGVRVGDDVRFGRDLPEGTDVEALLRRVGLGGMAERETATLSGGQLQRLAVSAALAREPGLLISDESTAMLDAEGREAVLGLMRGVSASGTTVVHVTHHETEAAAADREVRLGPPRAGEVPSPAPARSPRRPGPGARGTVELRGVSLVRDGGTPWDRPVITDLDLTVPGGTALAITGDNGAGKSTLAWLIAGLLNPTAGTVTVDGEPVVNGRGRVVIGVQHARLQVLRDTVFDDVADASGAGDGGVRSALALVGLDPDAFADRRADELSGGEQRRVVLAGLLASRPQVLVLDEPLAGLDDEATVTMTAALEAAKAAGTTLVIVTHDLAPLRGVVDRVHDVTASAEPPRPDRPRRHRPQFGDVVGRPLPQENTARSVWVGTKLAVLLATGVVMAVRTDWWNIGAAALIMLGWFLLAGAPWRAIPKLPPFFLAFGAISLWLASLGDGATGITVLGIQFSLSGIDVFLRGLVSVMVSLFAALLFCWTTPLGDVPGFLQTCLNRLGGVGKRGVAFASSLALAIRLAPLALSEVRTMWGLARQRRPLRANGKPRGVSIEAILELLLLATVQSCRRAGELADAITSRGGLGVVARPDRGPRRLDGVVVLAVTAILVVGYGVGIVFPGMVP